MKTLIMKKPVLILFTCFAIACNHPMRVTTTPDSRNTTSGTLGSAKVENTIPRNVDSVHIKNDTLKIRRN
jgi:hypothetical protein